MGRTNYSYNGMLSAIARKSLPRFIVYEKNWTSISTIFGNEYSTINKRGNDSLASIISTTFNTSEEYIKNQTTLIGKIYIDSDGFLRATGITSLVRGSTYTFYFSSDYGTTIRLSLTEDGTDFTEGVTTTDTTLTFVVPSTYGKNHIYIKSPTTPGLGSSLTVSGPVTSNYVYFDANDQITISGVTNIFIDIPYEFYFSADYGTEIFLSANGTPPAFTNGVSNTSTSITFTLTREIWRYSSIYIASPTNYQTVYKKISIEPPLNIQSWNLESTVTWTYNQSQSQSPALAMSGDGTWFSTAERDFYHDSNVYLYKNTDLTLSQTQVITENAWGERIRMSRDGNYLVALDSNSSTISHQYFETYKRTNDTWDIITPIAASGTETAFDVAVSEDATYIALSYNYSSSRKVEVFNKSVDDLTITSMTSLTSSENGFGYSTSFSDAGDTLCIGSPGENSFTGNVYVYNRTNNTWSSEPDFIFTGPVSGGYFGVGVSISGDGNYIAIGSFLEGVVYIAKKSGSSWSSLTKITGPLRPGFGYIVKLSQDGTYLVVGTIASFGIYGGFAYVYYRMGDDSWTLLQSFTESSSGDSFGEELAISSGGNYIFATKLKNGIGNGYVYYGADGSPAVGTIYFDNGILKAAGITSIIRGSTYTFYFSSNDGTVIRLSTTEDGTDFTEGVTTTDTTLTFVVPGTYSPSTIYIKSPSTSGIGSSLSVTGTLDDGTIYFDNGTLKATGITELERGNTYTFYFSSDYGTTIRLSTTEDGTDFTEGVTTTDTSLTFVVPETYPSSIIYIKSPTTSGIGSSLTVPSVSKLTASDGADNDQFGWSVSISGDGLTAIVGTFRDDNYSGSAYIYNYNNGVWSQTQKLTASDGTSYNEFGASVSISGDGLTAIVGTNREVEDGDTNPISVYIYNYNNGVWNETKLTASDGVSNDEFGISVSISDDGLTAIVGAKRGDSLRGSAYIYKYINASWSQTQKLTARDGRFYDEFGVSVSISDDGQAAIIGAYRDDSGKGSAYIFTYL